MTTSRTGGLARRLCLDVLDQVGDAIDAELRTHVAPRAGGRLLDVGCWDGVNSTRWSSALGLAPLGIEIVPGPADEAVARGVEVARIDLEATTFPWPDASIDAVVISQVLEHLKNVWLPLSEIARVLRPGGVAILSVPNLASLHNRALLGLGRQPTSIRVFGPHVRGFAHGEFRDLVAYGGAFTVERARTVGFYPLPRRLASLAARAWPGAGHSSLVVARRTERDHGRWLAYLRGELDGAVGEMEGSDRASIATWYG